MVDRDFVLKIRHPAEQLAAVAPLLCAGITTWSPLRHWNAGPGKKVGVVGIGGLGHMGVKLARALGILDEAEGVALRATFVVDPHNVVQHVYVTNLNVGRAPADTLRVVDALQTDELCACNRPVGGETLAA